MTKRGDIGLADLATVLGTLDLDGNEQLRAVGRALGLGGLGRVRSVERRGGSEHRLRARHGERPLPARRQTGTRLPPPAPALERGPRAVATQWSDAPGLAPAHDTPEVDALPRPPDDLARPRPVPRAGLFPRRTASGVLGAAAATQRPGDELDLSRLVARIVARQPLQPLPVLATTTLAHGVQLLFERSESMLPLRPDTLDLARAFATVVGKANLELFDFTGHPDTASTFRNAREQGWRTREGRPVVFVTDLGLGAGETPDAPVSPRAWRTLVRSLTRSGSPAVFLLPVPRGDWPRWLGREFNPLHWDPRTRAETVRAAIGPGHVVQR